MTIVKCSMTSCANNNEEICKKDIISLRMYTWDGFSCDTYKSEDDLKREKNREEMNS